MRSIGINVDGIWILQRIKIPYFKLKLCNRLQFTFIPLAIGRRITLQRAYDMKEEIQIQISQQFKGNNIISDEPFGR